MARETLKGLHAIIDQKDIEIAELKAKLANTEKEFKREEKESSDADTELARLKKELAQFELQIPRNLATKLPKV